MSEIADANSPKESFFSKYPVLKSLQKYWWVLVIFGFLMTILGWFILSNSVTNAGNKRQADLNAQYVVNVEKLGQCTITIREAAQIVEAESEAFDQIIQDAVKGRYIDGSNADPTGGSMFSAIKEAYPDLDILGSTFKDVLALTIGCRADYFSLQTKMNDMIAEFEKWRTGSLTVRLFGDEYPTDGLRAQVGDNILRGQDALDQMMKIITTSDAMEAYETGNLEPQDIFNS